MRTVGHAWVSIFRKERYIESTHNPASCPMKSRPSILHSSPGGNLQKTHDPFKARAIRTSPRLVATVSHLNPGHADSDGAGTTHVKSRVDLWKTFSDSLMLFRAAWVVDEHESGWVHEAASDGRRAGVGELIVRINALAQVSTFKSAA